MNFRLIINKVKLSDIGMRIATGAFWSLTGTALAKFIVLISGIICAHILGQEEYGEFGMVRSTINLFVVFGSAGLGMTASKHISEYRKTQKARISKIYTITNRFANLTGIIVTSLVIIFSSTIASETLNAPHLETPIKLGALLLFVTVLNAAQDGCLSGFEDFKSIAINTLLGSIAESVLMLVGGYFYGISGAILGFGSGFIVLYICNYIAIRRNFKKHNIKKEYTEITKEDLKVIYKFTLPAALSSFLVMPIFWVMRTMLVDKNGFEELAIYEAADQWKVIILFIPTALSKIILPILSSISNNNKNQFWKVLYLNIISNASIAFTLAMFIVIFSPYIMSSYGEGYNKPLPLILLALSTVPSSIASVIGTSIASRSKMWIGLSFNMLWAFMMITFTSIFLKDDYGSAALALSTLISYSIHSLLQFIYLRHCVSKQK